MNTYPRFWPVWLAGLCWLLASVWLSDEDTQIAALGWAGQTQAWEASEARAMVGTWYLVDATPDQADAHCHQEVMVRYRLRTATDLDYTLQCLDTQGRNYEVHGLVVLGSEPQAPGRARWWWPAFKLLHFPSPRPVMVVLAVDHPLGLASFRAPMDAPALLLSRSRLGEAPAIEAFMRRFSLSMDIDMGAGLRGQRLSRTAPTDTHAPG
jgi:lipocalin